MIYMCLDQRSKLQRNSYLVKYCSDVPVYGDAFVFRMESVEYDSGHPKYIDMPGWFAADANSLWGRDSLHVTRKLIEASSEHDRKCFESCWWREEHDRFGFDDCRMIGISLSNLIDICMRQHRHSQLQRTGYPILLRGRTRRRI